MRRRTFPTPVKYGIERCARPRRWRTFLLLALLLLAVVLLSGCRFIETGRLGDGETWRRRGR